MAGKEDFRGLTGQQKAAILMLSIGEDTAMKLFSLMDDDEIRELSQAMAGLGRIDSEFRQLGVVHRTGSLGERVEAGLRLGKRDDLTDVRLVLEDGDDPVDADRKPGMGRGAISEAAHEPAEARLDFGVTDAEHPEDTRLSLRVMDSLAPRAQLRPV